MSTNNFRRRMNELLACFYRIDVEKITPELISLLDRIGNFEAKMLTEKNKN